MRKKVKIFLIVFILMLFVLVILTNIFLLNFYSTKIIASTSQASIQFIISKAQAPLEPNAAVGGACTYNWVCTNWSPLVCPENEIQTRRCENHGTCVGIVGKPEETRSCVFEPEKKPLLDLKISILELGREIFPGETIFAKIELINFGKTKRVDAVLKYKITDSENNIFFSEVETVAFETKLNLIKEINLPDDLKPGKYFLYVSSTYDGQTASALTEFYIVKPSQKEKIFILIILALIIVLAILIYTIIRQRGKYVRIKKADLKKLINQK